MAHFLNGGNWGDGSERILPAWEVRADDMTMLMSFFRGGNWPQNEICEISGLLDEPGIDGLPERWVKIVKMEVTWGMDKAARNLLAEPGTLY